MPNDLDSNTLTALRQHIEELALEVALCDLSSPEQIRPLIPMLDQIRRRAESAQMTAVAEAASVTSASAPELRNLISRLQQLVEAQVTPVAPDVPLLFNQDPELVADFIMESREHLAALEAQLLALEQDPLNTEAINTIFRGFHTIKGLAGFLDFSGIQQFAHEVETLLDFARNSRVPVDSSLIDIILQSADHMSHCLIAVENGKEPASTAGLLVGRIRGVIGETTGATIDSRSDVAQLARVVAQPIRVANTQLAGAGPRSVKVDTAKLDYLVEMVGELVIAQSMIQHDPDIAAVHNPRVTRNLGQLTRITADVQRVAMTMRMIPVGQLFGRMARLVRDLARKSGKQANLELAGEETELDRNMVEELADPLMHMIRNAVDHGTERPEERVACGKSAAARLALKASHTGGFINIEISDDGRGLVREKILAKAQQRGLISGGEQLSDQEVFNLIFEPGFSTADRVTDVSGRGVGMDVVRKHIIKLRGRIDISSRPGSGTTFLIKLPLTMAVIEGLVLGVGVHRYIVPIYVVKEMFRPAPESLSTLPDGGEMVLVRGSLMPVLRLYRRFDVVPTSEEPSEGVLIVVESDRMNFCMQADELIGKQEVVIKSLGETFRNIPGIAGGAILGDGRAGLILDVEALFGNAARE
jgi:two-component system, chemotaxis family, sensor kinase CheA